MLRAVLLCVALSGAANAQQSGASSRSRESRGPRDIDIPTPGGGVELTKPALTPVSSLPRLCETDGSGNSNQVIRVDDIRAISDKWCEAGNPSSNAYGLTNMVWAFGQFIDHDIVGTIDDEGTEAIQVPGAPGRVMNLHRVKFEGSPRDRRPLNIHSSAIDGGMIYGTSKDYETNVLREPGSCRMRESVPGFLPITTSADSAGKFRWVAGDHRVDEHAVLTTMHTLFLREHNRLCEKLEASSRMRRLTSNRKFRIVKSTVIAKLQQITVNEFLPAFDIDKRMLQRSRGMVNTDRVSVEFSIAYRMGHTMIPDKFAGLNIADLFDSQAFYLKQQNGKVAVKGNAESNIEMILKGLSTEPSAEMDGKMSDALRNVLFGASSQEDLAARNIFRGRDLLLPSYAKIAKCFGVKPDAMTEEHTPDAWIGLLKEPRQNGQPLGPTHKAMMVEQFGRILFGNRGMWWEKDLKRHVCVFKSEVQKTTLAKVIEDNTDVNPPAKVFKMAK